MPALHRSRETALPASVRACGRDWPVRWGHDTALRIFALAGDPEATERQKAALPLGWFYRERPPDAGAAPGAMGRFLAPGPPAPAGPPQICFAHDADEIYSSFLEQYGVCLFAGPVHWHRFLALLKCLSPDTAPGRKMALRAADPKEFPKGAAGARLRKAQREARIPEALSADEGRRMSELMGMTGD